ncbi:ABC transporter ATP-binding protein [Fusobacterium animalis]|uniref:ABC transporter ATP-binding protein n=1 Tax=Fusobacterium animalis TaxID=76859 RepID=UPI0030CA9F6C
MKNLFKSIIFLTILIFSFSYYEEKIFKRYDILVDYSYYKIPKNSVDLLFIGSSHSYCTFNSRLFDHYLKCNSLNLGTDAQSLPITYSAILEILKNQNPKVIVIEVYPIGRRTGTPALRPHLDTMTFSINKLRLIKNSLPIANWGNHFSNTIYYHSRWKEFNELRKKEKEYGDWGERIKNKGFTGYNWDFIRDSLTYDIYEKEYKEKFDNSSFITKDSLKLLENIFKIGKKKGIKIILTSPPIVGDHDTLAILYSPSLKKLMNKYDIDSIDFNDGSNKFEKLCFLDNGHVSLAGADKVSFEMAEYLKQNYPILLNTKNYEKSDRSPEYYFYSESTSNDNNFKTFNLEFELEEGIFINNLKIYKKSNGTFDLYLGIDEDKSTNKIYEIALDNKKVDTNLDKIKLNFKTIKANEELFPKYYIRQIKEKLYIYKKEIEIPKGSEYYF